MSENKPNLSLPFLLLVGLGLLFIWVTFLMGMVYVTKGNFVISIFVSLVPLLVFGGILIFIYREKTQRRTRQNYDNFTLEYLCVGLYVVAMLVSFPTIFHFVEIEFSLKNKIQNTGRDKVISIREMELKYRGEVDDEIKLFKTNVNSDLNNYILSEGKDATSKAKLKEALGEAVSFERYETTSSEENKQDLETQVKNVLASKEKTLQEKYNLAEKDTSELVKQKAKIRSQFEKWDRVEVPNSYTEIDKVYEKYKALLQEKMPTFSHTRRNFDEIEMDRAMSSLSNAPATRILLTFLAVLVAHLFVLSPYLFTKRPKYKGLKRKQSSSDTPKGAIEI